MNRERVESSHELAQFAALDTVRRRFERSKQEHQH